MDSGERKARFIQLLEELLSKYDGIQTKLAQNLGISSARISSWLQRQIDPANLETKIFQRIANIKGVSTDELARSLGFLDRDKFPSNKFKNLIIELLSNQTQEQLGIDLGVKQGAISNWINPDKSIDPSKIPAATMYAIAQKKGWRFDDLLAYLDLKTNSQPRIIFNQNRNLSILVYVILEQEDITIASRYTADLIINLQINPDNIQVTTIPKLPQSLDNIDVLIFDISTADSPSIALIEEIEFKGNILVFAPADLPEDIVANLSSRVTEVLVKPIDWSSLKDKKYFR